MAQVPEFYVDPDLCTECGDCITQMPMAFRALTQRVGRRSTTRQIDEIPSAKFAEAYDRVSGQRHSVRKQ